MVLTFHFVHSHKVPFLFPKAKWKEAGTSISHKPEWESRDGDELFFNSNYACGFGNRAGRFEILPFSSSLASEKNQHSRLLKRFSTVLLETRCPAEFRVGLEVIS